MEEVLWKNHYHVLTNLVFLELELELKSWCFDWAWPCVETLFNELLLNLLAIFIVCDPCNLLKKSIEKSDQVKFRYYDEWKLCPAPSTRWISPLKEQWVAKTITKRRRTKVADASTSHLIWISLSNSECEVHVALWLISLSLTRWTFRES